MAKDKKAKAAQKKARVAAKSEKKAQQKDKKTKSRPSKRPGHDDDGGSSSDSDVDLDSILATYAAEAEAHARITESALDSPPAPVSSCTLIANPTPPRGGFSSAGEMLLFGGERIEAGTGLARFSAGLSVYRPGTDVWRGVTSPNSPLPRSGHAWCRGPREQVWLFGGEFSSPKQGTFHHYNDFWALDGGSREWSRVETKGSGPSARSGHRMVGWKGRWVLLFGGFQDLGRGGTRYLADLWVYDATAYKWFEPKLAPGAQRPEARSSFSFLPTETGAVIVGGYSRVKGMASKGGHKGGGKEGQVKPLVHTDCWALKLTEPAAEGEPPSARWERRKRPVNYPQPARAGATMAYHKGRGILFGGVHDVEESDEGIESEFFNQLWAYNIERNRFFPLALRRPKQQNKSSAQRREQANAAGRRGRGKADEEELLRNLALIEEKSGLANGHSTKDAATGETDASPHVREDDEDEDDRPRAEKPVQWEMPHPRFNAQLTVHDDTLYIYGGTYEKGDRECAFDELWSIHLGRLDGVTECFRREIEDWNVGGEESSDGSSEGEDYDDEDDEEEEHEDAQEAEGQVASTNSNNDIKTEATGADDAADNDDTTPTTTSVSTSGASAADDGRPFPQPFESLREFYARTTLEWQGVAITKLQTNISAAAADAVLAEKSAKEIKKHAFEAAEARWWDVREEVQAREDEMEAGGIGEVVQIGDRSGGDSAGRRR